MYDDAVNKAETSITSSILTLGCSAEILPAALTLKEEANALVMSEVLITKDVTAESSFFICAFPFRAYALFYWICVLIKELMRMT